MRRLFKRKNDEEKAVDAARKAPDTEAPGQKALESMRRIAEERRLNPTGGYLSSTRRKLLLELEEIQREAARLNQLSRIRRSDSATRACIPTGPVRDAPPNMSI